MSDENDEIELALTDAEWETFLSDSPNARLGWVAMLTPLRPHSSAALQLYGQPFGFTWEDWDVLESAFDEIPQYIDGGNDAILDGIIALQARIAALLPPRKTT